MGPTSASLFPPEPVIPDRDDVRSHLADWVDMPVFVSGCRCVGWSRVRQSGP